MLKQSFITLLTKYTNNTVLQKELWAEIETSYSNKKRYYHNLEHLNSLLSELNEVKAEVQNWETILFTIYYHDIVYHAEQNDNEEKSAELAELRMNQINVPKDIIDGCKSQILATKFHLISNNQDTNYFLDADLSILGSGWDTYTEYFKSIRNEYAIYPNSVYQPGRKKVLTHFLAMERIFKTDFFHYKFEKQAKQNLQMELELL
jgi:predicted metal-dependent HD superfamily phosphohydrolase